MFLWIAFCELHDGTIGVTLKTQLLEKGYTMLWYFMYQDRTVLSMHKLTREYDTSTNPFDYGSIMANIKAHLEWKEKTFSKSC